MPAQVTRHFTAAGGVSNHDRVFQIEFFEQLRQIVEIQLARLRKRLEERKIELELTDKARDYLAEHGYDPSFGARPLKRLIQRELETALGRKLLVGEVRDNSRVKVDANARGLDFKSEAAAPAAA